MKRGDLGGGPRSEPNDVYHLVKLAVLKAGIVRLLTPGAKSAPVKLAGKDG